ncbi:MAG: hypothetical protein A3J79_02410 [Elusimicrobia bacterium RIFOXYB2_FULL_62_6]|nr:MAG: hypothetical protein A3J79_02410 [Elusimicrobia bacterium RIFOXYB2_FULL_62_6]
MKKILLTFLLAGTLFVPAFAQLTDTEQAFIQKCYDNVDKAKKQLSPETAKECVTKLNDGNASLLNKLRAETSASGNSAVAGDIVAYNNALVDLKGIIANYKGSDLADALTRVIEGEDCALCDLGLGPKPESIFAWTGEKAGGRLFEVKKSVKTWEALGEIRINSLSRPEHGFNKEKWNEQAIPLRYEKLSGWAKKEVDKLEAFAAMPGKAEGSAGYISKMARLLWEDLTMPGDEVYREKLNKLVTGAAKPDAGAVSGKTDKEDKKSKEMASSAEKAASLKGQSTASQQDALNKYFDNAEAKKGLAVTPAGGAAAVLAGGAAAPKEFKPVKMTEAQAAALSAKMATVKDGKMTGYLADEIKGTKAGNEVLDFYNKKPYDKTGYNTLNLKFEEGKGQTANALGWWSDSDRTTRVNTNLVDAYCVKNKITPEQLLASDAHMKGVATYVAPNFVHESTHQRQSAWARANGLDFVKYKGGITGAPYIYPMEKESFGMQSAFSAEKASKLGPSYLASISPSHRANAEQFMEDGLDTLSIEKHALYPGVDSMEGGAAREFKAARDVSTYVDALEQKKRTDPAGLTEKQVADLRYYKGQMDTKYKWYTMNYQKSAADEAKLLAWRDSLDDDGAIRTSAPPAL